MSFKLVSFFTFIKIEMNVFGSILMEGSRTRGLATPFHLAGLSLYYAAPSQSPFVIRHRTSVAAQEDDRVTELIREKLNRKARNNTRVTYCLYIYSMVVFFVSRDTPIS